MPQSSNIRTIAGMTRLPCLALGCSLVLALASPLAAQEDAAPQELPPPIYEDKLLRLAEILGALSFLRDLCGDDDGALWRGEMATLLETEAPGPKRRTRLIARFNHGFETFNAVYRSCTPSASRAIGNYLREGQALASEVRGRYSQ